MAWDGKSGAEAGKTRESDVRRIEVGAQDRTDGVAQNVMMHPTWDNRPKANGADADEQTRH